MHQVKIKIRKKLKAAVCAILTTTNSIMFVTVLESWFIYWLLDLHPRNINVVFLDLHPRNIKCNANIL